MHRCWDIPEIVQEICWFVGNVDFSPDPWPYQSRADQISRHALVNLAKASRIFSHPATEALWYIFSAEFGLEPLLDSVADDLWTFTGSQGQRSRELRRGVNYQDLAAFKRRSARIRVLRLETDNSSTHRALNCLAAFWACASHDDFPLFPKLRSLWFSGYSEIPMDRPQLCALLGPLFGPQLRSLHISVNLAHGHVNASFLSSLTRRSRHLTILEMDFCLEPSNVKDVLDLVRYGSCLQTVTLTTTSKNVFNALSGLPFLEELTLNVDAESDFSELQPIHDGVGYSALARLTIHSLSDLSVCRRIVQCFKQARLTELRLYAATMAPLQTIAKLVELLPRHIDHSTLTTLSISEVRLDESGRQRLDEASAALEDPFRIQALHSFVGLTSLEVHSGLPASVGMESLRALANAVPNLTVLAIGDNNDAVYRSTPKFKLEGLPAILELFPKLKLLGIAMDATGVGWDERHPLNGFKHLAFESFYVESSPVDNPRPVAAYLSAIAPSLRRILPSRDIIQENGTVVPNPYSDGWKEVGSLVEFLKNVREQQRMSQNGGSGPNGAMLP
ncbi:hypothetical protein BKA70DRAFT_1345423 [Coprinopsis sp. MPI-PUGE-AT-0042]|nr:hypothetical protein BKA70DRAFT_1345423 [Coprinopsis sp. MPI-PUGE-AT-0042]